MRFAFTLLPVFVLWLPPAGPLHGQEKVKDSPYYPLKVGSRWVYSTGNGTVTVTLVKREPVGDVSCARLEAGPVGNVQVEHVAVRPDGIYRYQAGGKKVEPPLCFLKLPAKAGATWKVDSTLDGQAVRGTFTASEADIVVPAGKYKAVVVTSADFQVGGVPMPMTSWFVSGVGMVKQRLQVGGMEIVLELQKFTQPE